MEKIKRNLVPCSSNILCFRSWAWGGEAQNHELRFKCYWQHLLGGETCSAIRGGEGCACWGAAEESGTPNQLCCPEKRVCILISALKMAQLCLQGTLCTKKGRWSFDLCGNRVESVLWGSKDGKRLWWIAEEQKCGRSVTYIPGGI